MCAINVMRCCKIIKYRPFITVGPQILLNSNYLVTNNYHTLNLFNYKLLHHYGDYERNGFNNNYLNIYTINNSKNFFSKTNHKQLSNNIKKPDNIDDGGNNSKTPSTPEEPKLGIIARFRKMYKEYWYVLIPVHLITSTVWMGSFFYLAQSGVDIASILESMSFSETIINPLRDSKLGHLAVAYLLYKIATPARYAITIGGTTVAIKYLVKFGYIRPVLSRDKIIQMVKDRKDLAKENVRNAATDKFKFIQMKTAETAGKKAAADAATRSSSSTSTTAAAERATATSESSNKGSNNGKDAF